jgi:hypothetical protein
MTLCVGKAGCFVVPIFSLTGGFGPDALGSTADREARRDRNIAMLLSDHLAPE